MRSLLKKTLLFGMMLLMLAVPVLANEEENLSFRKLEGIVQAVYGDRILVGHGLENIYLETGCPVLDLETGERTSADTIQVGDQIQAFVQQETIHFKGYPRVVQVRPNLLATNPHRNYSVDMDYYRVDGTGMADRLVILSIPKEVRDTFGKKVARDEVLDNRLIVLYRASTRSLPPQTNPDKIILYRDMLQPELESLQYRELYRAMAATMVGLPEGERVYPVRAVWEQFDAEIKWDGEEYIVLIGEPFTAELLVRENAARIDGKVYPLDDPVILKDGTVYAGNDFFRLVWDHYK